MLQGFAGWHVFLLLLLYSALDVLPACCRDLLDGDAPGTGKEATLSKHERQQRRMQERIAKLEAQNMAEKDWFMQGESGAGLCRTDILSLVLY